MKLYGEAMAREGKDGRRKWVQLKVGLRMSCGRAAFQGSEVREDSGLGIASPSGKGKSRGPRLDENGRHSPGLHGGLRGLHPASEFCGVGAGGSGERSCRVSGAALVGLPLPAQSFVAFAVLATVGPFSKAATSSNSERP